MSSSMYTDCDLKKVDYTVGYENGPNARIHFLGRTHGGSRVHIYSDEPQPYFYVPYEQFDSELQKDDKVVKWEKGHEDIQGEHVVKVYTRIPSDVPKLRGDYDHLEADILWPNRVLIDNDIEGSFRIPEEHATPEPTEISLDDISNVDKDLSNRTCFADIEVDDSKGFPNEEKADKRIISITVYDSYREDYQTFLYHPQLPTVTHDKTKVRIYASEVDMLKAFCEYLNIRDFDVLAGWNFSDFDARYLVNRLDNLGDEEEIELEKNDISKLDSAYDDGYFGAKIKGVSVFDLLRAYENLQFTELDSYSLEDVAQEELGTGKIKDNRSLYKLWKEEPQKLVDYNFKDVKLTVRLDEEQQIIKFYEEIANYVGGRTAEVVDASKAVDIRVLRAVNGEWAVPSSKNIDAEEFEGAKVFDPVTGVKENVVVLDLASLYPMSMLTLNAGPKTKSPKNGELVAPNGVRFTNDKDAVTVSIVNEMLEERQRYKDLRDQHSPDSKQYKIYDRKQTAVKIVMNTLYGVLGWSRFRLYDQDVGAAVTSVGREVIKFTQKVVEEMGYEVIYGDTDSIMVELGEGYSKEEVKGIGFKLEEKINNLYDDFAKEELNADSHYFDIEFEKLYRRFFQAGKKKRYAGHITWKEGKEKDSIDIVGFEYQRSDYSKVAKNLMERAFDHILHGGELEDISQDVREVIEKLKNEEFDPDVFGIPSSVSQDFDEYESMTPGVKGSIYANQHFDAEIQPGDKPKMCYVDKILPNEDGEKEYPMPDPDPEKTQSCCWMNYDDIPDVVVWDWDEYIENQIKGPIKRILIGTDWSWGEIITGERQPRLNEYDTEAVNEGETNVMEIDDGMDEDLNDEFQEEKMMPWERQRMEARKQLDRTQDMLDGWEGTEPDGGEVIEATMETNDTEDDGPKTLDDYM